MQNQTSITDYYNENNVNNKNNCVIPKLQNSKVTKKQYCLVRTALNSFYKCEILYQTPKTICVSWFRDKKYFNPKTMTSDTLTIVKFLND